MTFLISILGIDKVQQPIFNVYGSGAGKRFQIHIIKIYIYCFRAHIMKYMLSLHFASSPMDCYFATSSTKMQQSWKNGPIYAKFSECCINLYPSKIVAIGECVFCTMFIYLQVMSKLSKSLSFPFILLDCVPFFVRHKGNGK
jgi:hypothetical protein